MTNTTAPPAPSPNPYYDEEGRLTGTTFDQVRNDLHAMHSAHLYLAVLSGPERKLLDVLFYAATMLGVALAKSPDFTLPDEEVIATYTHAVHDRETGAGAAIQGVERALSATITATQDWLALNTERS